jgi:hypothetical protein
VNNAVVIRGSNRERERAVGELQNKHFHALSHCYATITYAAEATYRRGSSCTSHNPAFGCHHTNRPAIAFIVLIYQNMSNKTTNNHTKIAQNPSSPQRHKLSDTPNYTRVSADRFESSCILCPASCVFRNCLPKQPMQYVTVPACQSV